MGGRKKSVISQSNGAEAVVPVSFVTSAVNAYVPTGIPAAAVITPVAELIVKPAGGAIRLHPVRGPLFVLTKGVRFSWLGRPSSRVS